ncbi:MAG: ThuA domain-containing protein [Candidatus Pacebacteria bacterium]|nr:ThuA domain-containing protein [Candidatus Paceibacterota bacterium]
MSKNALIVWGGWDGHTPKECADVFAPWLESRGYDVEVSNTLDTYTDRKTMMGLDLIVPMWTMGDISNEQASGLLDAIAAGVGIAGFHGGMCDSFRQHTNYQWMTGGQWVAHPGGCIPSYDVTITNSDHEITGGIEDFTMTDTEQYYLHVDPSNNVLATTTFENGCVMPAVWTRMWGEGRVFYASFGHTYKDFDVPEALEIVQRGMLWASR